MKLILTKIRNILKKYILIFKTVFCVSVLFLFWFLLAKPYLLKIPNDFSYKADVISVDNFYDNKSKDFIGESFSNTTFSYKAVTVKKGVIEIKNTFEVKTIDDKLIYEASPVYGINQKTGEHVKGYGDADRTGYLFAPRNLKKGQSYSFWNGSSSIIANMKFVAEEKVRGLRVFKYTTDYGGAVDKTQELNFLPEVPDKYGVKLNSVNDVWIEPTTGSLINWQDYSTDYYYYDIKTGEKVKPYNQFENSFEESTIINNVNNIKKLRLKFDIVNTYVPIFIVFIGLLIIFNKVLRLKELYKWFIVNKFFILIFFVMLTATWYAAYYTKKSLDKSTTDKLNLQKNDIMSSLKKRLDVYQNTLYGGKALFESVGEVSNDEWATYCKSLNFEEKFPGLLGLSFAKKVTNANKNEYVKTMQRSNNAAYSIKPEGERPFYVPVQYIQPLNFTNQKAIGFDLYSELSRRKTINKAEQYGDIAITPKITLIQDEGTGVPGFLAILPVFFNNKITKNSAPNTEAYGYITAPFRMKDFIEDTVNINSFDLDFTVYDGLKKESEFEYYNTKNAALIKTNNSINYQKSEIFFAVNRAWTLSFVNKQDTSNLKIALVVFLSGTTISSLLVGLILSISKSKNNAIKYGNKITKELSLISEKEREKSKELTVTSVRLSIATKSAKIGAWQWNTDSNIVQWDDQMNLIYETVKPVTEVSFNEWLKTVYPEDELYVEKSMKELLLKESELHLILRIITPSKKIKYVNLHAQRVLGNHGGLYIVGVCWDITAEKLSELNLKTLGAIVRDSNVAIMSSNTNNIITGWNDGAETLFGYTAKEMIGRSMDSILPQEKHHNTEAHQKILKGEETVNYETTRLTSSGRIINVALTVSPINDDIGRVIGSSIVARDITKEVEADRAKSEFVSLASHQLQTPATAVKQFLGLVLENYAGDLNKEQRDFISKANFYNNEQITIVRDLLEVARAESDSLQLKDTKIDVAKLIKEVIEEQKSNIKLKKQILKLDLKESIIYSDENKLKMCIANLINNSNKYAKEGSTIWVENHKDKDGKSIISIKDNGKGIKPEDLDKLFKKFARLDDNTQNIPGTGLGLYLNKKILERLGGEISVESEYNKGATFIIKLPEKNI